MSKKHKNEAEKAPKADVTPEEVSDQQKPDLSNQSEGGAEADQAKNLEHASSDQAKAAETAEAGSSDSDKALADALALVQDLEDKNLRLAAEFDNFRKRTTKEKEQSYGNGKADAVTKMLPIYDNLERALNQPTEDAAYKKGVELTMTELLKILNGLGVEVFGEVGDTFDPNLHNAVMHLDSEEHDENVITQVFQKGFKMGDKIVRFAMVQVAN